MLTGTLDDFTLADIFKLLSFSKKTGRVELTRRAGMGRVFFRDGEVYYAESSLSREPLGQKLVRARALTESHLRQALDENADTGERVGQILLREGWISPPALEAAVKQQIEDAVFDLLRWELGDFAWEPNVTLEPEVPISVSVENLIMESSRRLDELEIISRKVPSAQSIVAVAAAPPEGAVEINITPDEWRVLVLVDGYRSVETIANTIGLDEFQTMRIVHGMVSAGLIEVSGAEADAGATSMVPPPPPPPPALHDAIGSVDDEVVEVAEEPFHPVGEEPFHIEMEMVGEADAAEDVPVEVETLEPMEAAPEMDDEVVEETLYEVPEPEATPVQGVDSPPEEWFADPDLSMELFDTPAPGEMTTEVPEVNGESVPHMEELVEPVDEAEVVDQEAEVADAVATLRALEAAAEEEPVVEDPLAEDPVAEAELISDDTLVEVPEMDPSYDKPYVAIPPPPPTEQAAGADRSAAVRELAELFEDEVKERPKRPAIRRIENGDGGAKRRVEDDEQVTKGLISRLIEGVKGL